MTEGFLTQIIEFIIASARGIFMALFVNWWRKQTIVHISNTITHEKMKIKAKFDGAIPQIVLSWVIVNRSNVNLKINRIVGELHIGAWRVANFDSDRILENHFGYTWSPLIASQNLELKKKRTQTEVIMTYFPSLEFWFINMQNHTYHCSLYNSSIDVSFAGGHTTIKIPNEETITIEDFESVSLKYSDKLINMMKLKIGNSK